MYIKKNSKKQLKANGPFSAPCNSAIYHKNVIFVGTGTGLAPFLSFLDD